MADENHKASLSKDAISGQQEFDAYIHHISHDVRAAIRALTVLPEWIEEDLIAELGKMPDSVSDHINILKSQSQRVDQMMKDLLVYSQSGRGADFGPVSLGQALDTALQKRPLPAGFSLTRKLDVDKLEFSRPDLALMLDALLVNAIKHTNPSGTHIEIGSCMDAQEVLIWITDDGPGIPSAQHDRIFDPMTTLKPRDAVEGSGLGLAIVAKIITKRGGRVTVKSDPDNGASFLLRFPKTPPTFDGRI